MECQEENHRRAERVPIQADITFTAKAFMRASAIDISATGIRFETKEPLTIFMRITSGKMRDAYAARLVWAKRTEEGGMSYGFQFVTDEELASYVPDTTLEDLQAENAKLKEEIAHLQAKLASLPTS